MSHLTLNLSDQALQQALVRAEMEGRAVEEYVAGIVEEELAGDPQQELALLAALPDDDVLALADLRMSEEENRRMSELLDLNREGQLTTNQRHELDSLMDVYMQGTLKKAMGWAEAVRRKLREPLQP